VRTASLSSLKLLAVAATATLAACGGVQITPVTTLPKALVVPIPAKVGLVLAGDMREFAHKETRAGVGWNVTLGPGHSKLARELMQAAFRDVSVFDDLPTAVAASGLSAIFEPRIEQYSFATARDTGGNYFAVTIRYRINVLAPNGENVDSLTLTGYGNSLAAGLGGSTPLDLASQSAMRDAAAKFLVQFPGQATAKQLAKGEALVAAPKSAGPAAAPEVIEAVPIKEEPLVRS
jgi:hypothetical protein